MEQKLAYSDILKTALKGYKSQIWLLSGLLIGYTIIYSLLMIFATPAKGQPMTVSGMIVCILCIIISYLFTLGYMKNCFQTLDGEEPQFSAYGQMTRRIVKTFLASLIYAIIVTIGLCLLIVPGIYLILRLQFYIFSIVDEDSGIVESLKRSWEITKGHALPLLVIALIMMAICLVGLVIAIVGIFVAAPIVMLMQCYVFRKLTAPAA